MRPNPRISACSPSTSPRPAPPQQKKRETDRNTTLRRSHHINAQVQRRRNAVRCIWLLFAAFLYCLVPLSFISHRLTTKYNIQLRPQALPLILPQFDEELVEILRRQKIKLVGFVNAFILQPFVEPVKVVTCILELLLIIGRGIANFAVVLDLRDVNRLTFFNKEIRAEISSLRVLALLPCVFNLVESLRCVLQPTVHRIG